MISIRPSDDWGIIQELDAEIFTDAPRLTQKELANSAWWLAYADGVPVGFAGTQLVPGKSKAYMTRAGVLKTARGTGLQRRFIRVRVAYAKKHGIPRTYTYVWAGNFASQRSLTACGFKPYYLERYKGASYLYFENAKKPA